jgi:hypothetical protein
METILSVPCGAKAGTVSAEVSSAAAEIYASYHAR